MSFRVKKRLGGYHGVKPIQADSSHAGSQSHRHPHDTLTGRFPAVVIIQGHAAVSIPRPLSGNKERNELTAWAIDEFETRAEPRGKPPAALSRRCQRTPTDSPVGKPGGAIMKRTRRSVRKDRRSPLWEIMNEFGDWEPDPLTVELYRLDPQGRRIFLATLAPYERSVEEVMYRFGGGEYQIVVRYRGRVKVTPVFAIEGPPIDHRT